MALIIVLLACTTAGFAVAWLRSRRLAREHAATVVSITTTAERERAERQLTSGRLAAAFGIAPVGVLILDKNGTVVFANARAGRFVNGRQGDAIAETQIAAAIDAVLAPGSPTETAAEVELFTPTRRVLGVQTRRLDDDAGFVVFIEDLTEHHRLDAVRRDFVANASHELKTPLGALSVLAETLGDSDDPATRQRLTERITEQALRMSRLIDDVLDLALVESTSERAPVLIHGVVGEAAKHVEVMSDEYAVPVEVGPVNMDLAVVGDHRQLVSAVSNLLENAVKYTYSFGDGVKAPVELTARQDGDTVVIEVEDHGMGIPEKHLPRIFERFYRVDPARSRKTGGTGLGLAIVRHVILNHDGTIDVRSEPGLGSTFRITLPLGDAAC
jgi:two-component system sensor histidine kinase SenX3